MLLILQAGMGAEEGMAFESLSPAALKKAGPPEKARLHFRNLKVANIYHGRDSHEYRGPLIIDLCINNAIIGVALRHLCQDRKVVPICCRIAGDGR